MLYTSLFTLLISIARTITYMHTEPLLSTTLPHRNSARKLVQDALVPQRLSLQLLRSPLVLIEASQRLLTLDIFVLVISFLCKPKENGATRDGDVGRISTAIIRTVARLINLTAPGLVMRSEG